MMPMNITPTFFRLSSVPIGGLQDGDFESGNLPKPDLANLDVYLDAGARVNHEEIEVQTLGDYADWWRQRLAQRHAIRPVPPDNRLAAL